jgi:hypothetical protein
MLVSSASSKWDFVHLHTGPGDRCHAAGHIPQLGHRAVGRFHALRRSMLLVLSV